MAPDAGPIGEAEAAMLLAPLGGRTCVLAVSGGADSTALLTLAARTRPARTGDLVVASVDHGLRSDAAEDVAAVGALAARLGLPFAPLRWDEAAPGPRLQERARVARYRQLAACAAGHGADAIVTAHTLEDQAETVLMRLARGSGIDGLAAMRPATRRLSLLHLRPLLAVPKARLVATLREAGTGWIEDPSNADPRFERVRARRLLAALATAGLTPSALARLANRAARAAAALDAAAAALLARIRLPDREGSAQFDARAWAAAEEEIGLRALAMALAPDQDGDGDDAYPPRLDRLETLVAALRAAVAVGLPLRRTFAGHLVALARDGTLRLSAEGLRRRGTQS